jgi:hypothetical protein
MSKGSKSKRVQKRETIAAVNNCSGTDHGDVKSVIHPSGMPGPRRLRYVHLFTLICFVYLSTLTDKAFDWIGDGQVMFDTAVSLLEFGELGISPEWIQDPTEGGGTSDYYGKYGLGLSVVEQVPLWFVSSVEKILGEGRSNVLFPMMNMVLTALTAVLVALCLHVLGLRLRTQWLAAIGFAFATPAWAYVSYDFSEPLQALCLVAAFWFVLRLAKADPPSSLDSALAGFFLGFAVLTKQQLVILIPAYALYLWMCVGGSKRQRQRSLGWFVVTLVVWGAAIAALNHYRFGSLFALGYGAVGSKFTTPLLTGLYGLLLSPNKGIIFYAPLSILAPWSLWRMRHSNRRELTFLASVFVIHVLLISKWMSWEGGASWGPRLLMPVIPLMIICAAMLLETVRGALPLFAGCLAAGVLINLLGVLVNFLVWLNVVNTNEIRLPLENHGYPQSRDEGQDGKQGVRPYTATNYVPSLSPILGHAWLLRLRYFGVPFSLEALKEGSSTSPPVVPYPPIEINLGLLRDPFFRSHLRSAHFWMYETLGHQPREEIFTYPVYGVSIERQGDRAAAKGDRDRATECYARASGLMPNYASPALKLARLQWERGMAREAGETLQRYLSQAGKNRDQERSVRFQLGRIYEAAGYREAALEQYQRYLTLQPSEQNRVDIEKHIAAMTATHPE